MSSHSELEDWLTELPPLDGGDDDTEPSELLGEEPLDIDEGEASLDDATVEELEVDEPVEITEEEAAGENDDEWQADVGEPELDIADDEPGEAEADGPGVGDAELDLDEDLPASDDDSGEEGTTDAIELSLEGDLPALDADDDGDFEDALMHEVGLASITDETLPWAQAIWEKRPARSRELAWKFAEEDFIVALAMAVSTTTEVMAAASATGALVVASERTMMAESSGARATLGQALPTFVSLSCGARPVVWAAARNGQLARSEDLGKTWTRCSGFGRPILALGAHDDGTVSVLAKRGEALEISTSVDGSRWFAQRIAAEVTVGRDAWMVHRGVATAIGGANGVWIAREGARFGKVSSGAVAGTFAGPASDAPFVGAYVSTDDEDSFRLVRLGADGALEIVGALGALGDDDRQDPRRALALAWDEAHGTVRVLFAGQLSAWGPSPKDLT